MSRCLQQYLRSLFGPDIANVNATNLEMFRVNTLWTSNSCMRENKQAAEEIHSFPLLKLGKHKIIWKQHTTFLNGAMDDSKRYVVTKAFFALKGRTDITWNN